MCERQEHLSACFSRFHYIVLSAEKKMKHKQKLTRVTCIAFCFDVLHSCFDVQ